MRAAAAGVLRFSTERDPAAVAAFVRLRMIDPERAYWRRGIAAAQRWLGETGSEGLSVPVAYRTPEDWADLGSHPLGAWLADQRRYCAAGTLEAERAAELEQLGMVWSVYTEWEGILAVARSYAAAHGHFVPPATAVWEGQPIGTWVKNQRQAARKTAQNAARRAAGETGRAQHWGAAREPQGGAGSHRRGMVPGVGCGVAAGVPAVPGTRPRRRPAPQAAGAVIVQGEDLGTSAAAQRTG
nr:hypothetical protein StreXyl84_64680 [Streptomyces sp. Xyl84]